MNYQYLIRSRSGELNLRQGGQRMANNNQDNQMNGSKNSNSTREFESQGTNPGSQGEQAGQPGGYGRDTGAQGNMDDDDMMTAGGREGKFSESEHGKEGQWSPGSAQSSDQ
jgi:hypothetical protein